IENTRAAQDLSRKFAEWQLRQQQARPQLPVTPSYAAPPTQARPPIPAQASSPLSMVRAAQATIGPTSAASPLMGDVAELRRRYDALRSAQAFGAAPDSLASRGLRGWAEQQERTAARNYAQMTPQQQAQASPMMQALEARRREVEDEEVRRRQAMNREL